MRDPNCLQPKCGGILRKVRKDGRFFKHRGVYINLPSSIVIPRCGKCNTDSISNKLRDVITQVLETEFQEHAEIIMEALESVKEKK